MPDDRNPRATSRRSSPARAALVVRGPYRGAGGHDHHVREFVRHLARRGIRQQLVDVPEWGSAALPPECRDPWFDTLGRPVRARATLHFCMPHQVRPARGRLNVNYTMFEADRIPEGWVRHNLTHDLVIVPTASSRDAWIDQRVPGSAHPPVSARRRRGPVSPRGGTAGAERPAGTPGARVPDESAQRLGDLAAEEPAGLAPRLAPRDHP